MHVLATAFLALYLAHLVTDFLLQSDRLVARKRHGSVPAYLEHGAIHLLAAVLFLGFAAPGLARSPAYYACLVALTLAHLGIDWGKVRLVRSSKVRDGAGTFLGDQAVHLMTVSAAAWLVARPSASSLTAKLRWFQSEIDKPLLLLVVYVAVIFGGGHLVRFLTKPLLKGNLEIIGESTNELQNAGMYIGWLERFVVLTSLVLQSPATVGLMLTAKSIARYPELKSVRFAEYFLIGTLLSLTLGILGGLVLLKAFYGTVALSK